jgi:hypothetical protein
VKNVYFDLQDIGQSAKLFARDIKYIRLTMIPSVSHGSIMTQEINPWNNEQNAHHILNFKRMTSV